MGNLNLSLNKEQFDFIKSEQKKGETLEDATLRILGEFHQKHSSQKKVKINPIHSFKTGEFHPSLGSGILGEIHLMERPRKIRIEIEVA